MKNLVYYELTKQLYDEVVEIIDSGKVISAIKHLRNADDSFTLRNAKNVVDTIRYRRDGIILDLSSILSTSTRIAVFNWTDLIIKLCNSFPVYLLKSIKGSK